MADAESTETTKKNAEQQLAATLVALESSNNKTAELESLLASRDEQMAELTQVHARNSALEEELRDARSKLAETVDCVKKLSQECSELKELESNRSLSVDKITSELQESLDATKQQLTEAHDEKQSTASQLEHVQQLLDDSASKYSGLFDAHTTLQSDFDSVKQAFDQLKQDSLCSNDHTAAVVEECAMLKNTVEDLTVRHNAVLAEKQAACQEIADLKESLNDSVERCEKLKTRENLLCSGVVELNRAMFDKTSASSDDDPSVLSFSDCDIQDLFSQMLSEVACLQNKLELQRMDDERQLREKVENEKAVLLQEVDAMSASIQSLQDENKRLSSTIEQLESSQAELFVRCDAYKSQVVQLQTELDADRTSQDAAEQVEKTTLCPEMTLLQKTVDDKDAEIERLHQEIRAYKLDIERLEQERELHAVNIQPPQASVSCTYENRNVESQNCDESDDHVETQQQASDTDIDGHSQHDVVSESQPSGTTVELLNENQVVGTELMEMKEKMAEWEAMMLMLQRERDEVQLELQKLEEQQKQIIGTTDDVLQRVLSCMKGRDLFPSNSEAIVGSDGGDGELWNKLALLKTVVDELVFEMDEQKEKIHHMTDEVKDSEQRVLELEAESKNLKEEAEEKSLQLHSLKASEDALKKRELELVTEIDHINTAMSEIGKDLKDKDALVEQLQISNSDADKLNAEVESLRTEVASKDQLLSDAKSSEETLQQLLEEIKEQLKKSELYLISVESKYSTEIAELQAERDELSTRVCELQKDSDVMQQQSANVTGDLQQKYNDKCSEATELNKTITTYCKQIKELEEQLKVEVSEKEELKAEHTKLADALKDVELHLDQLRAETNNLNAAKVTLEEKLCSLQEESKQKVKLSESQISQLEASLSAIQVDYEKSCEQKSAMEKELNDKHALVEKLQDLGSDTDKLIAEVESLHTEVASKDQMLSDAKFSEEKLQQSLEEVKEQLRMSELHLSSVESKYSAEIAELQSKRDELSARVCELQKDSDVMQQQSANVTGDLQQKYNDKCSEATELNKTITTYCKQIEELEERLKVDVSEKEELKAGHTKLADALKDVELHLDQLRAETNNLNAAKITLEEKLCSLQEESKQKVKLSESQISQLEVSLSAIQVDYEKSCEQKSAMENELVDCTKKLEVTSSRLSQAEDQCSHQTAELLQVRTELVQLKEECRMQAVQKSASGCDSNESLQKSGDDSIETAAVLSTAQVCICICIIDCLSRTV